MKGLLFVIFTEEYVSDSGQHSSIIGQFGKDDLIPLQGLLGSTNDLVDVGNLEDGLRDGDDSLDLFECLHSRWNT